MVRGPLEVASPNQAAQPWVCKEKNNRWRNNRFENWSRGTRNLYITCGSNLVPPGTTVSRHDCGRVAGDNHRSAYHRDRGGAGVIRLVNALA